MESPSGPPTGFMVVTAARELYGEMVNGPGPIEEADGVKARGGGGEVPPRHVLPYLA